MKTYYIDKDRLIVLAGFIRLNSSSALISMETDDFKVEGTKGNWIAADEIIVDGRQFFLLQNDVYKDDVPYVVVSEDGKIVTDESKGFDEITIQKLRDFLHPQEKPCRCRRNHRWSNGRNIMKTGNISGVRK